MAVIFYNIRSCRYYLFFFFLCELIQEVQGLLVHSAIELSKTLQSHTLLNLLQVSRVCNANHHTINTEIPMNYGVLRPMPKLSTP